MTSLTFCTHTSLIGRLRELEDADRVEPGEFVVCEECGESMTLADVAMIRLGVADAERHVHPESDPDFD